MFIERAFRPLPSPWRAPPGRGCPFARMATELLRAQPPAMRVRRARPPPEEAAQPAIPWLEVLGDARREAVARAIQTRPLWPGEVLVRAGEPVPGWYGVASGFLKLAHATGTSAMLDTGVPERGWFGDHYLLHGAASDCTVTASAQGVLAWLPAELFVELVHEEPAFAQFVLALEIDRLAGMRARLAWPRRLATDVRVACRLAALFEPRQLFGGEYRIGLTQVELSDFLGLSRQRTNQALNSLRARGAIELEYGGIRIPDPTQLAARALAGEL